MEKCSFAQPATPFIRRRCIRDTATPLWGGARSPAAGSAGRQSLRASAPQTGRHYAPVAGIPVSIGPPCFYRSKSPLLKTRCVGWLVLELDETELCSHNPLGAKGCGEAGSIGAPAAIVAAVLDALRPLGVTDIEMP